MGSDDKHTIPPVYKLRVRSTAPPITIRFSSATIQMIMASGSRVASSPKETFERREPCSVGAHSVYLSSGLWWDIRGYLDHRFDIIEEHLSELEAKIGGIEAKIGGLEAQIGGFNAEIKAGLREFQEELKAGLREFTEEIARMKSVRQMDTASLEAGLHQPQLLLTLYKLERRLSSLVAASHSPHLDLSQPLIHISSAHDAPQSNAAAAVDQIVSHPKSSHRLATRIKSWLKAKVLKAALCFAKSKD